MNVNATLIVQAINFFIAYLFFRTLVFKPGCQILEKEQHEKDSLQNSVDSKTAAISSQEEKRDQQWDRTYRSFKKQIPVQPNRVDFFHDLTPAIKVGSITKTRLDRATQNTVEALVHTIQERYAGSSK